MEVMREEQYSAIRFCFRLKFTAFETYAKLQQAYGEDTLHRATVFRWFKDFKDSQVVCVKKGGSGVMAFAMTDVNINSASVIVRYDRRITLHNLSKALRISHGMIISIWPVFVLVGCHICCLLNKRLCEWRHAVRCCVSLLMEGMSSWGQLSLVMSHGCTAKILKENKPAQFGNHQVHQLMVITFFDCNGMIYQHYYYSSVLHFSVG